MSRDFYESAKGFIEDMFNDKEVSHYERLENLEGLKDEIETMIECVENDIASEIDEEDEKG